MDSGHGKIRVKVEGDRLSSLPDDVIHKILSFIGIKQAIETSALSSRWRYLWTSMPCLNFSTRDFPSLPKFSKFVTHVLSTRDNQTEVHSVKLAFRGKVTQVFVKRILDYAFSHNVQRLRISCLSGNKMEFPLSLFNSQSLKHLALIGHDYGSSIMTPPTWELPNLVTLKICVFTLNADDTDKCLDLFSNCAKLKNLTLYHCSLMGLDGFNICHPQLSSLTLNSLGDGCKRVNVVTPKLKNLTVRHWQGILSISAPNLSSLRYKDNSGLWEFSADFLHLKKVDICVRSSNDDEENAHKIVCLLQQIHSVKFLTLNSEIIEEIRAVMNVKLARSLMRDFQVLLDQWKEKSETNTAHMTQDEPPVGSHTEMVHEQVEVENHREQPDAKMKWHFGGRMAHIKNYWEDLNEQLEKGCNNTGLIISMLQEIEEVMTRLPTSHQAKLQERFFGLCAEAETIMDNVMDRMKIHCDKKPSRSNVYFQELAASQPLS